MFVAAIAFVLGLPVITAGDRLELRPIPFDADTGRHVAFPLGSLDRTGSAAILRSGEFNETAWSLITYEISGSSCFTLEIGPAVEIRPQTQICTESRGGIGPSMFIPASLSEGLERAVFVATVPSSIASVELEATAGAEIRGWLLQVPENFRRDRSILIAFLPAETDIAHAAAQDRLGNNVDVSRFVDQVDAY